MNGRDSSVDRDSGRGLTVDGDIENKLPSYTDISM